MRSLVLSILLWGALVPLVGHPARGETTVDSMVRIQEGAPSDTLSAAAPDEVNQPSESQNRADYEPHSVMPGLLVCIGVSLLGTGLLVAHFLARRRAATGHSWSG